MRKWIVLPLVMMVMGLLTGCSTAWVRTDQPLKPLYRIESDSQGIGLLEVQVDDDIMARAPNDFSNMTGLIKKAAKDYLSTGGIAYEDFTDLGYKAPWKREAAYTPPDLRSFKLTELPGIPNGVTTPLVTVVKVLDWQAKSVAGQDNKKVESAQVILLMSTWTRDGRVVRSETLQARAQAGGMRGMPTGIILSVHPDAARLEREFEDSGARKSGENAPNSRKELLPYTLREAVEFHYSPFLPQQLHAVFGLMSAEPNKAGVADAKAGRYDEALAKFNAIIEKDPNAHAALYNAACMYQIKGDEVKAQELLEKAVVLDKNSQYRARLDRIKERSAEAKVIEVRAPMPPRRQ